MRHENILDIFRRKTKVSVNESSKSSEVAAETILLTKEEHQRIRDYKPDLIFVDTGEEIIDTVIEQTLSLLQPLINQFEICVIDRIPPISEFH